ncbi:hypothetical protein LMG31506_05936 [Cupriavidus yeoncheonensis]|uniref:YtkA-like domain-containing protein n=1 Tax=Cupriavidus yeoncheonensis TaxID=1462994 RepID=A0A916IYX5_9BURK|nr:FixH family protein [Cupriavidus yeoncheonensis]CAG2157179.1 hypothetical protein LMG31506_05936 [Cupriavidus yeoncheonensis]
MVRTFAMISMLFAGYGCTTPPQDLDLSRDKSSDGGRYQVAIVAPAPSPAINQMHSWKVRLTTPDGNPVRGAQFSVAGGMPQHGHGYPTQPRVTREVDDGTYLLEGMKFSMSGWWDLKLGIRAAPGPDQVAFNIVIDPRSQRP